PYGTYDFTAAGVDGAGNVTAASVPLRLTIAGPTVAPGIPDLLATSDTGVSSTDDLTNATTATIEIEGPAAGLPMSIYVNGNYVGEATQVAGTTYRYTFAAGQLVEGENAITARQFSGGIPSYGSPALTLTLDTTAPPETHLLGDYGTLVEAHAVAVVGSVAYVIDHSYGGGLLILDVSTPSSPALLGSYTTASRIYWDVEIVGTLAYVSDHNTSDASGGLQIIDVSTPSSPVFVGQWGSWMSCYDIEVVGSLAYTAWRGEGFKILDVSVPSSPALVYETLLPDGPVDVEVVGSVAFVASGYGGLHIVDVSTPASPSPLATYSQRDYLAGVEVRDGLAYLAYAERGLEILDVSDPSSPSLLGACRTPGPAQAVEVSGSFAYVSDTQNGLHIVDISDPASPALVVSYAMTGGASDVAVAGSEVFIAAKDVGLQIVGFGEAAIDLVASSDTGPSDDDNITDDTTPTFDVLGGEPYVRIYRDGGLVSGSYETEPVTLATQPDGTYDYTARAVDAAGNVSELSDPLTVTIDTTPAVVATVVVNGLANRGVSGVVSQTAGVTTIEVTFDEPVSFDAGDVVVQTVTFPGGVETIGDTLTPESVTGSGTDTMTITLADGTAVGTWVKVTLGGTASIADLAGNLLDGEPAPGGSGRGYLYDAATDLPSGDGTAGGDAVFFVGSCIGDCSGDGKVNIFDAFAFNQAWGSHTGDANYNPKADFTGDGNVNIFDAFQLNSHWGHQMDSLPSSLPMGAVGEFVTMLVTAGSVDETISAAQELVRAVTAVLPSGPLEEKPGESGAVPLQEEEGDGAGKAMTSESQEVTALVSAGELKQQAADDMLAAPATDTEEATKLAVPSSEAPLAPDDSRPPISTPGTELVNQLTLKSPTMAGETVEVSWLQDLQAASFVPTPYPQGWQRDINKTGARQLDVETADSQVAGRVVLNSLPPSGASVDVQEGVYQQGLSASFASRVAAHKHVTKRAKGLEDGSEDILVLSKLEVPLGKGKNDGRGD
ncbi:MAG TPA: Ig-like domain-containing protein, partial [Planctomycetota bacterium]|nr:Ig-like domain-containing protein [Planctomycetota bacterium]